MSRYIDADAMLEYLDLMYDKQDDWREPYNTGVLGAINYIKNKAPTIDAVSEWIPCSERLPEETGRYLCTVGARYRNPREMYYAPQEWADKSDQATWRSIDGNYVFDWFVIAWQPLPKPWKGADNDSKRD